MKIFHSVFLPTVHFVPAMKRKKAQIIKKHLCWEARWIVSSGKYLPKQEYYITHATAGTTCWICIYVHRERARASQAAPAPAVFHPCQSIRQLDSTASEKSRKNPTLTSCWAKKKKAPNMWMESAVVTGSVISSVTVSSANSERLISPGGGWAGNSPSTPGCSFPSQAKQLLLLPQFPN